MTNSNRKSSLLKVAGVAAALAIAPALMVSPADAFGGHGGGAGGGHGGGFGGGHGGSFGGAHAANVGGVRNSFASANVGSANVARGGTYNRGGNYRGRGYGGGGYGYGIGAGAALGLGLGYGWGGGPYAYNDYYDGGYGNGYYDNGYAYNDGYAPQVAYGDNNNSAYCAQTYKSYNPATGTYLGYDGLRHSCP